MADGRFRGLKHRAELVTSKKAKEQALEVGLAFVRRGPKRGVVSAQCKHLGLGDIVGVTQPPVISNARVEHTLDVLEAIARSLRRWMFDHPPSLIERTGRGDGRSPMKRAHDLE